MSKLLKSKFLLGVMTVAIMFVGGLAVSPATSLASSCSITSTLRVGSKGAQVMCLQTAVGVTADGSFGPMTKAAVMAWQTKVGLTADGVFGPKSLATWMSGSSMSMTYPAGCTSNVGFSPTTGMSCATGMMTVTYPAGCVSASGFSPTTGASCATGVTTTVASGPVSAMLSSDNPASGYIIDNQATADMAHFTFTGTGTVTSVTLQRTGISNQNTLDNVYLFQGNTRITDGYSFNNTGVLVINNLAIAVNGSTTISVRADVDSTAAANASTIGINLTSFTSSGNAATTTNLMGNVMYLGTGSPASVYLNSNTNTVNNVSVNAGTSQYTVWSAPIQINTRAVWLKGANFRITGSAPSGALANIHLTIDGVASTQVATIGTINGSTYAMFDFTANPISLSTGSHTMAVLADIVGGSSYNAVVSIQQAADLVIFDPQVGVNVAATTSTPSTYVANSSGTISIAAGSASTVVEPTFQSMTNITGGSTNAVIGRFMVTGYGEDVKVSTLDVTPVLTSEVPSTYGGLQNLTLYFGQTLGSLSQVGSSYNWTSGVQQFNLGSQMIIPAGSVSYIEVRADLQDSHSENYTSGTVSATLNGLTGDAQGQTSHASINFPGATGVNITGTSLTIQTGLLAVSKNTNYASQSIGPNTGNAEIGSYILQNQSTSESVRVTQLLVGVTQSNGSSALGAGSSPTYPPLTDFSSLHVVINGTSTTPVQPTGSDTFSINNLTIAPGATQEVDIYASTSATNDGSTFATNLVVTAIGATSNVSIGQNGTSLPGTPVVGQVMTLASGTVSPSNLSLLTANSTAQQFVPAGNGGATNATKATFQLNATGGTATITEMKFTVNSQDVSAIVTACSSSCATGSDTLTTTNTSVTSNGSDFKVGDVVVIVGATSNGLGTVNGSTSSTSVPVAVTVAPVGAVSAVHVVPATVASITVNGQSAPVVNGVAYLTGLNLAVPNGGGGLTQDVYISYAPVGTNGVMTGATSRVALEYFKYTSGGTTSTVCSANIATCSPSMTAVSAPTMKLVSSAPILALTPSAQTLNVGTIEIADVTVTANTKGDVTLNALPLVLSPSSASNTEIALTTVGCQANGLIVKDFSGNPVTTTNSAMLGSTDSSCATSATNIHGLGGGTTNLFFGTCTTAACTGQTGYRITAGQSQTFKIYAQVGIVLNTNGAHTDSISTGLGGANLFGWVDTGGNASATTGTDVAGSPATTVSNAYLYGTTAPGFLYNYPTSTVSASS